jgi:hypothetical protein
MLDPLPQDLFTPEISCIGLLLIYVQVLLDGATGGLAYYVLGFGFGRGVSAHRQVSCQPFFLECMLGKILLSGFLPWHQINLDRTNNFGTEAVTIISLLMSR